MEGAEVFVATEEGPKVERCAEKLPTGNDGTSKIGAIELTFEKSSAKIFCKVDIDGSIFGKTIFSGGQPFCTPL